MHYHNFSNGITLLGEPIPHVKSAAFSILFPAGSAYENDGLEGTASILSEMFHKGAGSYSNRDLSEAFEAIGAHRNHSAGIEAISFSGVLLGENIEKVLELYATVIRQPTLPESELEVLKSLALQELDALEDEPSSKVMVELSKQFFPHPFGRSPYGTKEGIEAITINSIKDFYKTRFQPNNCIIGVSGFYDWDRLVACIEKNFGDWTGSSTVIDTAILSTESKNKHLQQDTSQVQIAFALPSVSIDSPDYYVARVANGVLSGGMSGRLFIEVREKRGLVYRRAALMAYAGTTPDNANETFNVMRNEIIKLKDGVSEEELTRSKTDLKARLIMQGESTSARASSIASDWWNLKRVRTLDEIKNAIDAVTSADIEKLFADADTLPITLVTLGPKGLEI